MNTGFSGSNKTLEELKANLLGEHLRKLQSSNKTLEELKGTINKNVFHNIIRFQ